MSVSAVTYPNWRAPTRDGEILVWPTIDELLRQTGENHRRLDEEREIHLQNLPLAELRRENRRWLGHADNTRPLLATGHQAELYHPGVWIKNVLVDQVAGRLDGKAIFFIVDTDAPKHLKLRWPGQSWPITNDARVVGAAWSGLLAPPTPEHLQVLRRTFEQASAGWSFQSCLPIFFDALVTAASENQSLSAALADALHSLDETLGLRYQMKTVSPLLFSPAYLVFAHHILARADEFAAQYNLALDEHRRIYNLRTPTRPMPNLKVSAGECEVPFWLDDLKQASRRRAFVRRVEGRWNLCAGDERFVLNPPTEGWSAGGELGQWLQQNHLRLSPRALTLTMYMRLLVSDLFVHGIGGGLYEQINDSLIARYFGLAGLKFAVATATLYPPQAENRSRVCLPCLAQEGHRLRHQLLGERKMEMVSAIAELPQFSSQRQQLFNRMHSELNAAAASSQQWAHWQEKYERAKRLSEEDSTLFDRELFYAIQPRSRLLDMIAQIKIMIGQ